MIYTNLYDCCSIQVGKNAGAIFDFEKGVYVSLPLEFCEIFIDEINIIFEDKLKSFDEPSRKILINILDFLIENGFIYQSNDLIYKRYISEEYYSPFDVESFIVDFDDIRKAITYLKEIRDVPDVESVQIRVFDIPLYSKLKTLIVYLNKFSSQSIELIIRHSPEITVEDYIYLINDNPHVSKLVILNHSAMQVLCDDKLVLLTDTAINKKSCGKISEELFQVNNRTEITSKTRNSCLNCKISVDVDGNIKNCPSMPESYGNIKDTTLQEVLNKPGFKKYWNITKDQIEVCKDCEFRYVCTDCRAYTERTHFNKDNMDFSKPLKCGYDPNTGEWAKWSTNPLKKKAIEYYGMQDLVEKFKRVRC
ncbi:grasp-with-spasm system SPASM domain peptide maturase [Sinomicrobium pectinilyticum]|uniref:Grasp-with-spasm system SPASM domain peptide maturase n=1 Tax=Sinomicrobium pectinilyticum TaxID=1084421 RepID=A0A3N0EFN3_SINP1|nr:grasp-with-spasm system SPASM domain peptide maturase [Sinomicrobium pectinilyticum]RNL86696.1 grasp-with-spasm system SPASM domain peptide maturase [Sinomicrobium pectinilyticum]